jgi:hypothetical protein
MLQIISQCADIHHVSGNQLPYLTQNDWILLSTGEHFGWARRSFAKPVWAGAFT